MESRHNRTILIGLTIFCILMIGITVITDEWLSPLRTGVGAVMVPVQSGVNRVGISIYNRLTDLGHLLDAQQENKELQARIDALTEENNRLTAESFELLRLRQLYDLDQEYMQYEKTAAHVIASDSGDWFQVFRVDKGYEDGIRAGDNVMVGGGLCGIVADVGAHYATVRSIIDDSSRVSAMAVQSGDTCIVAGDLTLYKEGRLRITNIRRDADIKDGDRIITSNISSRFLPGILVGYAQDITLDSNQLTSSGYLVPAASFTGLQEVLIITELKETGEGGQ